MPGIEVIIIALFGTAVIAVVVQCIRLYRTASMGRLIFKYYLGTLTRDIEQSLTLVRSTKDNIERVDYSDTNDVNYARKLTGVLVNYQERVLADIRLSTKDFFGDKTVLVQKKKLVKILVPYIDDVTKELTDITDYLRNSVIGDIPEMVAVCQPVDKIYSDFIDFKKYIQNH